MEPVIHDRQTKDLRMAMPTQQRIIKTALPGPRSVELQASRDAALSSGLGQTLPVFVEEAGGAIIVDVDGNHIIDMASGIAVTSVGASHPRVVQRIAEQAEKFTHTCFLVTQYDVFTEVAQALNRITPGEHAKKTALFSTGAEAVENAIKIARVATGRPAVVVLSHAYHGRSLLTMSMTAKNVPYKEGFGPFAPEVYRAPSPYPYRWTGGAEAASDEAFAALEEIITTQIGPHNVAAVVVEPIQGEGGFIVPPAGYLARVQELTTRHGIVFVADEIQTGLARTGDMFACDHEGIVPDMITTAKALGGGMPLAAVTGRADLMDAVPAGGLGGTYAGNPVACAAALGAIEAIEQEGLVQKARDIASFVVPRLQALMGDGSPVGEVRGRGAMLAMEFVEPGTREPAPSIAKAVAAHCHREGVLVLVCGTFSNVIRLLPPLVIEQDLLDDALAVIEAAVGAQR
jgi:4-aminobutyrate aminotransferase/(S)-3-amino-2-methylpropionate transaminase